VRVPVPAAGTPPVYAYFQIAAAIHDSRMDQYKLLHSEAAVRQLSLILKEVPQGTDSYLDNALHTAVQQLQPAVRKSDGSYSEVRALLCQHCMLKSILRSSTAVLLSTYTYKKPGRSSRANDATAFVARAAQGGGLSAVASLR
jgi:hypothetical protein